jgi:uncharacterized alpha-E superfamily protein
VLSRIAENVYWLGRYVERADDTVRLVATHYYGLLQIGTSDGDVFPAELLAVLGHPPSADPTPSLRAAVTRCVTDPDNQLSVASCLRAARENARRSREVLSLELWETLSAATRWLDTSGSHAGADELLREAPQWTHAFYGLVDQTMRRGPAWRALRLGMLLERADMTVRVLILAADTLTTEDEDKGGPKPDDPLGAHLWTTALRACSALDAFWATSPGLPTARSVARVLLRDEDCPRSLVYCLREAGRLLDGASEPARQAEALAGQIASAGPAPLLEGGGQLRRLLAGCQALDAAIAAHWLEQPAAGQLAVKGAS